MIRYLLFLLTGLIVYPAAAQQTPPPPRTVTGGGTMAGEVGQILFDAAEQTIIEKFFGREAADSAAGRVIRETARQVMTGTTQSTSQTQSSERDDDRDDDKSKSAKNDKSWKQNKAKGKGKGRGKGKKGLPPGLAKRKSLPPGLQKQLERNGKLPPGLQTRQLPDELWSKLPPAQQGTERVIADNDVVLIHKATGVVLDILRDVVTK